MSKILVISTMPDGYRRGGVKLNRGENFLDTKDFTEKQLEQLENDPRLNIGGAVVEESDTANQRIAELVEHIKGLDTKDTSLWKEDQTPKASAFPKGTTADERTAAWDAFVEQLDGAK